VAATTTPTAASGFKTSSTSGAVVGGGSGGVNQSKLAYLAGIDEETHNLRIELDRLKQELQRALDDKKAAEASAASIARSTGKQLPPDASLVSPGLNGSSSTSSPGGKNPPPSGSVCRQYQPLSAALSMDDTNATSQTKTKTNTKNKKGVPFLAVLVLMVMTFLVTYHLRLVNGWGPRPAEEWEKLFRWPLG
jgi:hypothetical protein